MQALTVGVLGVMFPDDDRSRHLQVTKDPARFSRMADYIDVSLNKDLRLEAGTSLFIRFDIQLCHAFLTIILLRHGQLHHVGNERFPMRSLLAAVPSYAKKAREIVACAGIAGRGQGRRD